MVFSIPFVKRRAACVVLLYSGLACCLLPSAFAWSDNAHKAVALVAEDLLNKTPEGRNALNAALALLSTNPSHPVLLDDVAPCPDFIRLGYDHDCAGIWLPGDVESAPWHFIDLNIDVTYSAETLLDDQTCPGGNCVIAEIKRNVATLQSQAAAPRDRTIALIFLVHLVGDLHQPLHCINEFVPGPDGTPQSDRGGNEKLVVFDGHYDKRFNLHALWDRVIEYTDSFDPKELAAQAENGMADADVAAWQQGDLDSLLSAAALESFADAKIAYQGYYQGQDAAIGTRPAKILGPEYQQAMQGPIAIKRIGMAGVRLAAILTLAFNGASNAP